MSRAAELDPSYWVNVRNPRVNKALSPLDVHQTNRQPVKSPDGTKVVVRRGPEARARRALKAEFRRTHAGAVISFRNFVKRTASANANQLTGAP